jgi:hypothetical protein
MLDAPGPKDVGRQALGIADPDRLPDGRIRDVQVDLVDVVREVDRLALLVVQRDVEVRGGHQFADDLVDGRVERRHIAGGAGRLGDAIQRALDLRRRLVLGLARLELRDARAGGAQLVRLIAGRVSTVWGPLTLGNGARSSAASRRPVWLRCGGAIVTERSVNRRPIAWRGAPLCRRGGASLVGDLLECRRERCGRLRP